MINNASNKSRELRVSLSIQVFLRLWRGYVEQRVSVARGTDPGYGHALRQRSSHGVAHANGQLKSMQITFPPEPFAGNDENKIWIFFSKKDFSLLIEKKKRSRIFCNRKTNHSIYDSRI